MSILRLRPFVLVASALLAASCNSPSADSKRSAPPTAQQPQAASVTPAPAPSAAGPTTRPQMGHWVQDWRIRAIMQSISINGNPSWPKNLPDEPERSENREKVQRSLKDAASLADGLALAALQLPQVVADRKMSDEDRRGFTALAEKLRQQSYDLKEQANDWKLEQVNRTLDSINRTCFECHTRYRDLTGLLDPGRASLDRGLTPQTEALLARVIGREEVSR